MYMKAAYTGDGGTKAYTVPFIFIDAANIKVYVNNVLTTAYTWGDNVITFTTAPAINAIIDIIAEPTDIADPIPVKPQQATTAAAPTFVKGGMYFDTTTNKLMYGGASAWKEIADDADLDTLSATVAALSPIKPQQAATAEAPAYAKGAIYFDTTLNKLMVGGATAWETVTSAA